MTAIALEARLLEQHAPLARRQTFGYYLPGGEREDLEQEAMVGALRAIRSHDASRGPLEAFVHLAAKRGVQTAVKVATRLKARPLNNAIRDTTNEDGDLAAIIDFLPDHAADPARIVEDREELQRLVRLVKTFSPLERAAVIGRANGETYESIAARVGGDVKSIDNAIARARLKFLEAAA